MKISYILVVFSCIIIALIDASCVQTSDPFETGTAVCRDGIWYYDNQDVVLDSTKDYSLYNKVIISNGSLLTDGAAVRQSIYDNCPASADRGTVTFWVDPDLDYGAADALIPSQTIILVINGTVWFDLNLKVVSSDNLDAKAMSVTRIESDPLPGFEDWLPPCNVDFSKLFVEDKCDQYSMTQIPNYQYAQLVVVLTDQNVCSSSGSDPRTADERQNDADLASLSPFPVTSIKNGGGASSGASSISGFVMLAFAWSCAFMIV